MFTDQPIKGQKEDAYNRAAFSQMLGDVLISMQLGDSVCIGLMGPWGSGKTSIINMVEEYITSEKKDPLISVIRFEPWNFTTPEQLISQFFVQLASFFEVELSGKEKVGLAISEYANRPS